MQELEHIEVGQQDNDGKGDLLRRGMIRVNDNFAKVQTGVDAVELTAVQAAQTATEAKTTADAAIPAAQKGMAGGVAPLDASGKVPATHLEDYALADEKGAAGGFAPLDAGAKVPMANLPAGTAGGIAPLDASGKVPAVNLPAAEDAIPLAQKGQPGGVATLGSDGKVPSSQIQIVAIPGGSRNKLINALFSINQRGASGTVTLPAGGYGHDRFKAGAGGCTYTFSTSGGVTTLNITAGTLMQVVGGGAIIAGPHVLSWVGTATGRINSGVYQASPVRATLAGGADVTVEFGAGSLSRPQFESGDVANLFEVRPVADELALARWYWRRSRFEAGDWITVATPAGGGVRMIYSMGPPMRIAAPTVGIDAGNWEAYIGGVWTAISVSGAYVTSSEFIQIVWGTPSGTPVSGSMLVRTPFGCNLTLSAEL
ncbi:hypothetical protein [Achromobacter ruhlandii]|uniref:hypothetical protein n=1 Tax=Achromobacter ruhlandii TaxID=72557 RepID=UPI001B8A9BC0|nr:hypothetical protein [Achromobacter ruhlandii]